MKYNSERHPELLLERFAKGETVLDFCAAASISRRAFYNWIDRYPEFEEAYEIGKGKAHSYWMRVLFEVPNFPMGAWLYIMKSRFRFNTNAELRKLKLLTFQERIDSLEQLVIMGEIDWDTFAKGLDALDKQITLVERAKIADRLKEKTPEAVANMSSKELKAAVLELLAQRGNDANKFQSSMFSIN